MSRKELPMFTDTNNDAVSTFLHEYSFIFIYLSSPQVMPVDFRGREREQEREGEKH